MAKAQVMTESKHKRSRTESSSSGVKTEVVEVDRSCLYDPHDSHFAGLDEDLKHSDFLTIMLTPTLSAHEAKRRRLMATLSARHIVKQLGASATATMQDARNMLLHLLDIDDLDIAHAVLIMVVPFVQPFARAIEATVPSGERKRWECFVDYLTTCRDHLLSGLSERGGKCTSAVDAHFPHASFRSFVWRTREFYLQRSNAWRSHDVEHSKADWTSSVPGYVIICAYFLYSSIRCADYSNLHRNPAIQQFETPHVTLTRTPRNDIRPCTALNITSLGAPETANQLHSLKLVLHPVPRSAPARAS